MEESNKIYFENNGMRVMWIMVRDKEGKVEYFDYNIVCWFDVNF